MKDLIFDIDGTLWDIRSLCADGYNRVLREKGLPHLCVDLPRLQPMFGKTLPVIADILFASVPEPERYRLVEACDRGCQEELQRATQENGFPGIRQVLEELARKHRLYIVSNCCLGYAELAMEKLGITHLITDHLCYGDTGLPKGQTIRQLMERNRLNSCVYIGDTQGDLEASREAGIPFVWCSYGFGVPEHWDARTDTPQGLLSLAFLTR